MKKIKDIESALAIFEDAGVKHAEATESGEYKKGKKCYRNITEAVAYLKDYDALLRLEVFLKHSSVGVRTWAASYLLTIRENESVEVLEEIASATGIHALNARTTISEWKKGNLRP